MATRRRRPPNPVAAELVDYFLTAEADQGVSSSWGAFTAIALGGFGGAPDPERRVTDRRFGLGPARRSAVTRAREIRAAFLALPRRAAEPSWYDVLFAAHGSIPWREKLDEEFGRGMGAKVLPLVGSVGVALLSAEVYTGYAAAQSEQEKPLVEGQLVEVVHRGKAAQGEDGRTVDAYRVGRKERPRRREAWATPRGWLVALCLTARLDVPTEQKLARAEKKRRLASAAEARARLGLIKGQAIKLLAEAEAAYRAARKATDPRFGREERAIEDRAAEADGARTTPRERMSRPRPEPIEPLQPSFASEAM